MITLRTYTNLLRCCADNGIPNRHLLSDEEQYMACEFIKSELISKHEVYGKTSSEAYCITPKGALALQQWERDIEENTFRFKFLNNLSRLAWILIGALAVSMSDLLEILKNVTSCSK